jgi:hypothetical protein
VSNLAAGKEPPARRFVQVIATIVHSGPQIGQVNAGHCKIWYFVRICYLPQGKLTGRQRPIIRDFGFFNVLSAAEDNYYNQKCRKEKNSVFHFELRFLFIYPVQFF